MFSLDITQLWNMVSALDPINSIIKRLWCTIYVMLKEDFTCHLKRWFLDDLVTVLVSSAEVIATEQYFGHVEVLYPNLSST